jgi:hypothetical protein
MVLHVFVPIPTFLHQHPQTIRFALYPLNPEVLIRTCLVKDNRTSVKSATSTLSTVTSTLPVPESVLQHSITLRNLRSRVVSHRSKDVV